MKLNRKRKRIILLFMAVIMSVFTIGCGEDLIEHYPPLATLDNLKDLEVNRESDCVLLKWKKINDAYQIRFQVKEGEGDWRELGDPIFGTEVKLKIASQVLLEMGIYLKANLCFRVRVEKGDKVTDWMSVCLDGFYSKPRIDAIADQNINISEQLNPIELKVQGGEGKFTYSLEQTNPEFVFCSIEDGVITSQPAEYAGTSIVTVTVTDEYNESSEVSFAINVNEPENTPLNISSIADQTIDISDNIVPITTNVEGGEGTVTLTLEESNPEVVHCTINNGIITSDPAMIAGDSVVTLIATDEYGDTTEVSFLITVNEPIVHSAPVINTVADVSLFVGETVSGITPLVEGGQEPITLTIEQSNPEVVNCTIENGVITSQPAVLVGDSVITIIATDSMGARDELFFTITVEEQVIVSTPSIDPIQDMEMLVGNIIPAYQIFARDGVAPITLTMEQSNPEIVNCILNNFILTSDQAVAEGTNTLTITATDSLGAVDTLSFNVIVGRPASVPTILPIDDQTININERIEPFDIQITGGEGPVELTVTQTQPAIVECSIEFGTMTSGFAFSAGTSEVTVIATDSLGAVAEESFTITVNEPIIVPILNVEAVDNIEIGIGDNIIGLPITVHGAQGQVVFELEQSSPEAIDCVMDNDMFVCSPASSSGISEITITATDEVGAVGTVSFSVLIFASVDITLPVIADIADQELVVGTALTPIIPEIEGGEGEVTIALEQTNQEIISCSYIDGEIVSGPAISAGTSEVTVTVTDSLGAVSETTFIITVTDPIVIPILSLADIADQELVVGTALTPIIPEIAGGEGDITIELDQTNQDVISCSYINGEIVSEPAISAGTSEVTVIATDSFGTIIEVTFTITVNEPPSIPVIENIEDQTVFVGTTITSITPVISGGEGTITITVEQDNQDVIFCSYIDGSIISGVAIGVGTSEVTVIVTDSLGAVSETTFTITVNEPPSVPEIENIEDQTLVVGATLTAITPVISGGEGTITVTVEQDNQDVIACSYTEGEIVSEPAIAVGTSEVTVTVTDSLGAMAQVVFTITVNVPPSVPTIVDIEDQSLEVGTALTPITPEIEGGEGERIVALEQTNQDVIFCSLVDGNIASGPANSVGTSEVTVTVTDGLGATAQTTFTITVTEPVVVSVPTIGLIDDQVINVGESIEPTDIQIEGGEGTVAITITQTNPEVVNCSVEYATITSEPALIAGDTVVTVTATDSLGAVAEESFSITVNEPIIAPTLNIEDIDDFELGIGDTIIGLPLAVHGAQGQVTFELEQTNQDVIACLMDNDMFVSGPALSGGISEIKITATDETGAFGEVSFSIIVTPPEGDNQAPTIDVPDQNILINDALMVDLSTFIADAEDAFSALNISITAQSDINLIACAIENGHLVGTATDIVGINQITIEVADSVGAVSSQTISVSVYPGPMTYKLRGLNFGPYIGNQDPNDLVELSEAQIEGRLKILSYYTERVKVFGTLHGLEHVGRIGHALDLEVMICAWLTDDMEENTAQMQSLVDMAKAGHVDVAVIGSEVLYREDLTAEQLLTYINQFKTEVPDVPVTYADTYGVLMDNQAIIDACDIIYANFFPYWEGVDVSTAIADLHDKFNELAMMVNGKKIVVSETGWPSDGDIKGAAVPNLENAVYYLKNFVSWAEANDVDYFIFEAFNENWKAQYEDPQGAHWGMWYENGMLKPGMQAIFDGETIPDNWSCDTIPGNPEYEPEIVITGVSAYGTDGYVTGQFSNANSSLYQVAVYIKVGNQWWTKPYSNKPITTINCNGTWTANIATGGNDKNAREVMAFLINHDYIPPVLSGATEFPQDLLDNAVDQASRQRN